VGVGDFLTPPSATLHVNTNILTPSVGVTAFPLGDVIRTDCPLSPNYGTSWQMYRGGQYIGRIYGQLDNDWFLESGQLGDIVLHQAHSTASASEENVRIGERFFAPLEDNTAESSEP
jgi:hypothetical protein